MRAKRQVNCPTKGQCGFQSIPIELRFWAQVKKTETCWLWGGAVNGDGYGCVKYKGRMRGAHRIAYMLAIGPIPDTFELLHKCDNPPCVNPDHLVIGSHADNIRDMFAKGRGRPGGRNPMDIDIDGVMKLYGEGLSQHLIGKRHGVSQGAISRIVNNIGRFRKTGGIINV